MAGEDLARLAPQKGEAPGGIAEDRRKYLEEITLSEPTTTNTERSIGSLSLIDAATDH